MGKIISAIIILFCLPLGVMPIICRACNLSLPFHGCLLDAGTCSAKHGQYCKIESHEQGGVEWFVVKGCTTTKDVCHSKRRIGNIVQFTQCCYEDMCNF